MNLLNRTVFAAIIAASATAQASGPQPPSHAQHSYSFTCPSGASGQVSDAEDSGHAGHSGLTMWVNGQYIQSQQRVVAALQGKSISQARGGCDGERTTVLLEVSDQKAPVGTGNNWVTVLVDRTGHVTWVGV